MRLPAAFFTIIYGRRIVLSISVHCSQMVLLASKETSVGYRHQQMLVAADLMMENCCRANEEMLREMMV